jgi:predicted metal-binding protein
MTAMAERAPLEKMFAKHGFEDFRWFDPRDVVVAQWVRLKCLFGCREYGKTGACPPHTPSVAECERFFREYRTGAMFHFEKRVAQPEDRHAWSREMNLRLSKLEREVFLSGYVKAFLLFMDSCTICQKCSGSRADCKEPHLARPTPEAMAVDVYATVLRAGYPIEVLPDFHRAMNRYAFLLID